MGEYILIFILQFIGCGFQVGQKVYALDKKFEGDTLSEVFNTFLKSDRVTLIISGFVLALNLVTHYIVDTYAPHIREMAVPIPLTNIEVPYIIAAFITALMLGYFGQWLIYKIFGKAEEVLNKKLEAKLP